MSILLGAMLAILVNTTSKYVIWVAIVGTLVFSILTIDAVILTRKTLFKVRGNKAYGKPFRTSLVSIFKPVKPHPLDSSLHVRSYYIVNVLDGSIEYVDRLLFYQWLVKVWAFQNSPMRHPQQSPLGQNTWGKELGGFNRYQAYMYILETVGAIDPESGYHVKKLRMRPWNIITAADNILDLREV